MLKETELLIEGEYISLIKREVIKTVRLSDFTEKMAVSGYCTGLLPAGCRISGQTPNGVVFYCIERPPMVTYANIEGVGRFIVSVGFLQFWLGFPIEGTLPCFKAVTTTKWPVGTNGDQLYAFPWPNVYSESGAICTGSIRLSGDTIREVCEDFVRSFLGASFNRDLSVRFPAALGGGSNLVSGFKTWADKTNKNQLFGLSPELDYRPLMTIPNMLDQMKGGRDVR